MFEVFPTLPIWLNAAIIFVPALLNIWSIWHAFSHKFPTPVEQLGWMGLGVFVPVLGGIIYLFIGRRRVLKADALLEDNSAMRNNDKTVVQGTHPVNVQQAGTVSTVVENGSASRKL